MVTSIRPLRALPIAALGLLPAALGAQLAEPVLGRGHMWEIGLARPIFARDVERDLGFASLATEVRVLVRTAGGRSAFFAQAELSHATLSGEGETALGNLVVGVMFGNPGRTWATVSATLPTFTESGDFGFASGVGAFANPLHPERYMEDSWAIDAGLTSLTYTEAGGSIGIRLGGEVVGYTANYEVYTPGGAAKRGKDAFARYGFLARTATSRARLSAELDGYALLTESDLSLGERTFHLLTASLAFPAAGGAPEIVVQIPVDADLRDYVNAVFALRLAF